MRVAFISGVCVKYDAVSDAMRNNVNAVARIAGSESMIFSFRCDYVDLAHVDVRGVEDVANNPFFRQADVVVFHFAIFNPLFYALLIAPVTAKIVVIFHNITPKELLPVWQHDEIDRSFEQLSISTFADLVLCDSETNREVLVNLGISERALVHRLSPPTQMIAPRAKQSVSDDCLRVAFVGRFVRSKGPQDLLDALELAMSDIEYDRVELAMIGNLDFSDQRLLGELRSRVIELHARFRGRLRIEILGNASHAEKVSTLDAADIFALPTYHEGFCIPILEALMSGCRVLTYDGSNLPSITGGFANLVETGNVPSLGSNLATVAAELRTTAWIEHGYSDYVTETTRYTAQFNAELVGAEFVTKLENLVSSPWD